MLVLQTRSEEPEQQKDYVVHVFGWLVFGSVNLAAHSIGRDDGMIVLKTDQKGDSSCVFPHTLSPSHPCFGGFFHAS